MNDWHKLGIVHSSSKRSICKLNSEVARWKTRSKVDLNFVVVARGKTRSKIDLNFVVVVRGKERSKVDLNFVVIARGKTRSKVDLNFVVVVRGKERSKVDLNFVVVVRWRWKTRSKTATCSSMLFIKKKAFSADSCDFPSEKLRGTGRNQHFSPSPLFPTPPHNKVQQISAMHTEHEHAGKTEKVLSILFVVKYNQHFSREFLFCFKS